MFRTGLSDDAHMAPALYFPWRMSHGDGLAMAMATAHEAAMTTRDTALQQQQQHHQYHLQRSLPDALRCGYTSKRCENPRTVKKSGGLHRFCAYHRERANKNQWRVDNRRRLLRKRSLPAKTVSDCGSPRSTTSDTIEDADAAELGGDEETDSTGHHGHFDLLDPAGSPDTLSDQDAKILNAMLFSDEDEPQFKAEPLDPVEASAFETDEPTGGSTATHWNCMCSQCLAWPTTFFYHDAFDAARTSRIQTYARV